MQAFRAATTIDEERQLRLSGVPFRPGTAVDVIVLEHGGQDLTPAASAAVLSDPAADTMRLAEKQHHLAAQYPGEYVVLVGEHVVHHSSDRQEAIEAYRHAAVDDPSHRPVVVSPGSRPRKPPIVRGRALAGKLRRTP